MFILIYKEHKWCTIYHYTSTFKTLC